MKPFAFVLLGSLLLSCGGGGGVSPSGIPEEEACPEAAATFCKKIYGCTDGPDQLVQLALTNEAACEMTILQDCASTAFHCGEGMTYHPEQALACKNGFNAEECTKLGNTILTSVMSMSISAAIPAITADVPACATICSVP